MWLLGYKYFVHYCVKGSSHFSHRRLFAYNMEKTELRSAMKWQFWLIRSFHCMLCRSDSESKWWIHISSWIASCEINLLGYIGIIREVLQKRVLSSGLLVFAYSDTLFICWNAQNIHSPKVIIYIAHVTFWLLSLATIRSKYYFNFILNRTRSDWELFDHHNGVVNGMLQLSL